LKNTKYITAGTGIIYVLAIGIGLSSCIRSYEPEILAADEMKYVVSGTVTDEDGTQTVNVSITSPVSKPQYNPVTGCSVTILDDRGHAFPMEDAGNGDYRNSIDLSFLQPGVAFRIEVMTPQGDLIRSDFDTLTRGPEVDSLYWIRELKQVNNAGTMVDGIQFYLDLHAAPTDSRYYRWEAIETWEYHTPYPLEWYYDGTIHHTVPPDSSKMICWRTVRIPDIYTLTTDNLAENRYDEYRLHYVNNLTTKLAYGYSVLVRQFALSREAFTYYENLRFNSNPDGGLYERQPLAIQGNMHNLSRPEKNVLGFFAASASRSKRIFVYPIPDLPLMYNVPCDPTILRNGLKVIKPNDYPAYLQGNSETYFLVWMENECVDCQKLGGSLVKPDFWPF
jgi:hypothetical protein